MKSYPLVLLIFIFGFFISSCEDQRCKYTSNDCEELPAWLDVEIPANSGEKICECTFGESVQISHDESYAEKKSYDDILDEYEKKFIEAGYTRNDEGIQPHTGSILTQRLFSKEDRAMQFIYIVNSKDILNITLKRLPPQNNVKKIINRSNSISLVWDSLFQFYAYNRVDDPNKYAENVIEALNTHPKYKGLYRKSLPSQPSKKVSITTYERIRLKVRAESLDKEAPYFDRELAELGVPTAGNDINTIKGLTNGLLESDYVVTYYSIKDDAPTELTSQTFMGGRKTTLAIVTDTLNEVVSFDCFSVGSSESVEIREGYVNQLESDHNNNESKRVDEFVQKVSASHEPN